MHERFSIETAMDCGFSLIECNVICGCDIGCKFDICDGSTVGSAAVNSNPDDVGMKTG